MMRHLENPPSKGLLVSIGVCFVQIFKGNFKKHVCAP